MNNSLNAQDAAGATILRGSQHGEQCSARGVYTAECYDSYGQLKWSEIAPNVVTNEGKNLALNTYLAGVNYTVTGAYMGLISATGFTGVAVTDTATGINVGGNGWNEAGINSYFPFYTSPRKTAVWAAAVTGSKSLSSALSFPIVTNGGTVKGCFLLYGSGALTTIGNANGTLYSAGLFAGGDKIVAPGDTLSVSYTTSL